METHRRINLANNLRNVARYSLLFIGGMILLFALFSGAESFGGGLKGLFLNLPNTIPWALLIVLVMVAWKYELAGGLLITGLGIFLLWFFNQGSNFFVLTFIATLIITLLGSFFLISYSLRRKP